VSDNASEFLALTSLLALIVGVLFLLLGLFRMGWVANFLSRPVLQGFTQGIALIVMVGQLPTIFGTRAAFGARLAETRNLPEIVGLESDYSGFLVQAWAFFATVTETHAVTAMVGISSFLILVLFKRFQPTAPSALIVVLLTVLVTSLVGLDDRGVAVVGTVQTGMVALSFPSISAGDVVALMPGALAIVLLGYAVSLSVADVGARRTGETIDPNQELIALGGANFGAALSSSFVVCASLSRGVVVGRAGGRTQVAALINGALVLITLMFALPLFFNLPSAALAAVVVSAMSGLLDFGYLRRLYGIDRSEFAYAMAALLGVILLGILYGVALGVLLAFAVLIKRVSGPGTAVLGRVPGTNKYRDVAISSSAEQIPGLLIFRFDAPIIFANSAYFAETLRRLVADASEPTRLVLIPAQQINDIDSTGADQLVKMKNELREKGIGFAFAEVKSSVREMMRRTGLEEEVGTEHFYDSVDGAVQQFLDGGSA
jgi:high affinity sulfate transporter 1